MTNPEPNKIVININSNIIYLHVVPPEEAAKEEAIYLAMKQEWVKTPASEVDAILAKREVVEADPDLPPDVVEKIKKKIAAAKVE